MPALKAAKCSCLQEAWTGAGVEHTLHGSQAQPARIAVQILCLRCSGALPACSNALEGPRIRTGRVHRELPRVVGHWG